MASCRSRSRFPTPCWLADQIVDTPGIGSVHAHNTTTTERFVGRVDIALCVLAADQPLNAPELELIATATDGGARPLFAINKIDQIDAGDLPKTLRFVAQGRGLSSCSPESSRASWPPIASVSQMRILRAPERQKGVAVGRSGRSVVAAWGRLAFWRGGRVAEYQVSLPAEPIDGARPRFAEPGCDLGGGGVHRAHDRTPGASAHHRGEATCHHVEVTEGTRVTRARGHRPGLQRTATVPQQCTWIAASRNAARPRRRPRASRTYPRRRRAGAGGHRRRREGQQPRPLPDGDQSLRAVRTGLRRAAPAGRRARPLRVDASDALECCFVTGVVVALVTAPLRRDRRRCDRPARRGRRGAAR